MTDDRFFSYIFVHRGNGGSTAGIPESFFFRTPSWSTVALAVYFHILTEEEGITFGGLCANHPDTDPQVIANALVELAAADLITTGEVYRETGYQAAHVKYVGSPFDPETFAQADEDGDRA